MAAPILPTHDVGRGFSHGKTEETWWQSKCDRAE